METLNISNILVIYPELSNCGIGPHGITYLQIICAYTKQGEGSVRNILNDNIDYINKADYLGRTALHYAAYNGNLEIVRLLLEEGAVINSNKLYHIDSHGNIHQKWILLKKYIMEISCLERSVSQTGSPLHFAVSGGSVDCTLFLIGSGANLFLTNAENLTPIELIILHEIEPFLVFFDLFLNRIPQSDETRKLIVNSLLRCAIKLNKLAHVTHLLPQNRDSLCEMQFLAVDMDHVECLKLLVEDGLNFTYCRHGYTLLEQIFTNITNPEEFILNQLDGKIKIEQQNDPTTRRICFDFNILAPKSDEQMNVLNSIVNLASAEKLKDFLSHPLIDLFLKLKWEKVRGFFYTQILTYAFFVLTLSVYVMQIANGKNYSTMFLDLVKYLLIISTLISFIHASLQIRSFKKSNSKCEIAMSWLCAFVTLIIIFTDSGTSSPVPDWSLHATSIVILYAWIQLMLLIGRIPYCGYYALMFTAVLQNVVKVLITFVYLLFGFALSFSIQFYGSEQFNNPLLAILKTTVMMMGEYEYTDLFSKDSSFRLPVTSRIIFLLFVILVSIVLMNLMIGLAVNDIHELQEKSHSTCRLKQIDFIKNFEEVLQFIQRIDDELLNVFSFFVRWLQHYAKLELVINLDLNSRLEKKYIDKLYLKILRRQTKHKDINHEIAQKILCLIKNELQTYNISSRN